MDIEKLQEVIGSPEENRQSMVEEWVKDMKLFCTQCESPYKTPEQVALLDMEIQEPFNLPEILNVFLLCPCGYQGIYQFKPNPFIKV